MLFCSKLDKNWAVDNSNDMWNKKNQYKSSPINVYLERQHSLPCFEYLAGLASLGDRKYGFVITDVGHSECRLTERLLQPY